MTSSIIIKMPDQIWINSYIPSQFLASQPYHLDRIEARYKLDQNESPFEWPLPLKERVLERLKNLPWNRYPQDYCSDLEDQIAAHAGVAAQSIILGPGSNSLIASIMQVLCSSLKGKLVIADPSFPLYREVARNMGVKAQLWELDDNLEYDPKTLDHLPEGSLIIFASPNNPVGNHLKRSDFEELLKKHPRSLFLADEAYFEFTGEPYTSLLENYSNFISLRTFSKTLAGAALRLGYAIAHPSIIYHLRKVVLPYLINPFTLAAAQCLLEDQAFQAQIRKNTESIIKERNRVYQKISELRYVHVYPSYANFLLIRWPDSQSLAQAKELFKQKSILLRDVSAHPRMSNCLRLTIGSPEENQAVLDALKVIAKS